MNTTELTVKMILDRWYAFIKMTDTLLETLSNEQLEREVAPGKNRGIYLLGHLIAVHDDMIVLLNFGEKLYPELNEPFLKSPDKAVKDIPTTDELKAMWNNQNAFLTPKINSLTANEWFQKHTAVSEEDFAKEPHRNLLNIMITRTNHLSNHLGQMALLKS